MVKEYLTEVVTPCRTGTFRSDRGPAVVAYCRHAGNQVSVRIAGSHLWIWSSVRHSDWGPVVAQLDGQDAECTESITVWLGPPCKLPNLLDGPVSDGGLLVESHGLGETWHLTTRGHEGVRDVHHHQSAYDRCVVRAMHFRLRRVQFVVQAQTCWSRSSRKASGTRIMPRSNRLRKPAAARSESGSKSSFIRSTR